MRHGCTVQPMHRTIEPAIQYWGTPVVLVSTLSRRSGGASLGEDGRVNVAPMSSVFWLGWTCMLGLDATSHTVANLERERSCVLNLASAANADAVNALALTTGSTSVPLHKKLLGYRHEPDKLGAAGLSTLPSLRVSAPRIAECPVHLEAVVEKIRPFARGDARMAIPACSVELRIVEVHVEESLLLSAGKVDPARWTPLIMSFRRLFARGEEVAPSRLARGDEAAYAPWKGGFARRAAAQVLRATAELRYGIDEGVSNED